MASMVNETISLTGAGQSTPLTRLSGNDSSPYRGEVVGERFKKVSGDGTQWTVRWFLGTTANPKLYELSSATFPDPVGFIDSDGGYVAFYDEPIAFSTVKDEFPNLWSGDNLIAGAGLRKSYQQTANAGATNDVMWTQTIVRRQR